MLLASTWAGREGGEGRKVGCSQGSTWAGGEGVCWPLHGQVGRERGGRRGRREGRV